MSAPLRSGGGGGRHISAIFIFNKGDAFRAPRRLITLHCLIVARSSLPTSIRKEVYSATPIAAQALKDSC